ERHPHTGLGKPEPLKGDLSGYWSRRITKEHRLVYKVEKNVLSIAQCRFHY
ncbi:MAG: Txe/YoeB family addiction module toxin, partial [Nitrospirae bacterium]